MRTLTYIAKDADAGRRVQSVLEGELQISSSLISRLKSRPQGILVNGAKVYTTYRLAPGDILTATVVDEAPRRSLVPCKMELDIVYEDEDFLIINKPAGLAVQPTQNEGEMTLENGLLAYLPEGEYPHPVSRLDRGTTGLMAVAKSGYGHELLKRRLHTKDYYREYRGVIAGTITPANGCIEGGITTEEGSSYKRCVSPTGAPSLTEYETLQTCNGYSLLRLIPRTGRTHQLRVHLAYAGHPLVGDWLYGEAAPQIGRPALHSYLLYLKHPLTGEELTFTAPLPEDMAGVLLRSNDAQFL